MKAKRLSSMNDVGIDLAVELLQLRLVVEQLELARPAGHEQVDDALRLGREVRRLRRQRVDGRLAVAASRRLVAPAATPAPSSPSPTPHCAEEVAAGLAAAARRRVRGRSSCASLPRDELVEVQQHPGHRRPGGRFGGVGAVGSCSRRSLRRALRARPRSAVRCASRTSAAAALRSARRLAARQSRKA